MLNFGDMLTAIEGAVDAARPAYMHGDTIVTWGEAARASNNLARHWLEKGAEPGEKVAIYLRNEPAYLIALSAAFKARLVPVNVNYRYTADELVYLLDNADATIVVYGVEFRDRVAAIAGRLPKVASWLAVGGPPTDPSSFAALIADGTGEPVTIPRSADDLLFIYTGGTTGMPKGVMWPHGELREVMVARLRSAGPVPDTPAELAAHVAHGPSAPRVLTAPPLMHGSGLVAAIGAMLWGGTVVTLTGSSFEAREMLAAIERHRPTSLSIVGDSFARPMLNALLDEPDRYDLSSVEVVMSSGVMWSVEVKRGLLDFMPGAVLLDLLASSEAPGLGMSSMSRDEEVGTARFTLSDRCRVLAEDGSWVTPGSGRTGQLALAPPNPLGYYKDAAKTETTFRVIDGVRYCIPGDWCRVEDDGGLILLGRGSACINTGGEKVFSEEVEEAVKTHASVEDCLAVGVPDPQWGQAIVAVVTLGGGAAFVPAALRDHLRSRLAGYKVPKRIVVATSPLRGPNGKGDYAAARICALEQLDGERHAG